MLCFVPRPVSGELLALECHSYWIKVIICSWNFVSIMCSGPDVVDVLVWRITKLKVYTWVAELFLLICQASHESHDMWGRSAILVLDSNSLQIQTLGIHVILRQILWVKESEIATTPSDSILFLSFMLLRKEKKRGWVGEENCKMHMPSICLSPLISLSAG